MGGAGVALWQGWGGAAVGCGALCLAWLGWAGLGWTGLGYRELVRV